jgi:hypothetical protein
MRSDNTVTFQEYDDIKSHERAVLVMMRSLRKTGKPAMITVRWDGGRFWSIYEAKPPHRVGDT